MSTKDFENSLVEMVVNYVKMQDKKKQKEILSLIVSRVSTPRNGGGAGGGDESAAESDAETKPAKPKRAPTEYNIWMKEIRSLVAAKNPEMKPQQITAEIGRLWNIKKDTELTNEEVMAQGYPHEAEAAPAPAPAPVPAAAPAEKKVVVRKK